MYYVRFTVSNPFVSFTKLVIFVLDIYNLFKLQTTYYSDLQCLGKKNLILFYSCLS